MKRFIFLVVLFCYPVLGFGATPTSSVPISSSSSTTTTSIIYCFSGDDAECEDNNPCTSDYCLSIECYYYPDYLTLCDDGLYCNGDDRCYYGDCSEHSGDPCPSGTVCNEDTDSCDPISGTSTTTTSNQGSSTSTSPTSTSTVGGSLSISGYVMGAIDEDVTVLLAGTALLTSITDTDGYYEFSDLASGYYTLKPDKDGYSFEPPNHVIPNLTSDLMEMNFEAKKTRCLAQSIYGEDSEETELLQLLP